MSRFALLLKTPAALALALALLIAIPASATDLSVVHGIPGSDLGLPEDLPVDISLNGGCTLTNVPFGTVSAPLAVDPGLYVVEIRLADGNCGGDLAIVTTVALQLAESSTVIAHLTDSLTITATKFVNDLRPAAGLGRVTVRHTADAPAVDVFVKTPESSAARLFSAIANGDEAKADVAADDYNVGLTLPGVHPDSLDDLIFSLGGPNLPVGADANTIVYAVGSVFTGSFTVLVQSFDL